MIIQVNALPLYNPGVQTERIWNSLLIRDLQASKKNQKLWGFRSPIAISDTYKQLRSDVQ